MATIKIKLRLSSVPGKKGTLFYQITHRHKIHQITTSIHLHREEWNPEKEQVNSSAEDSVIMQSHINDDMIHLKRIIRQLDASCEPYEVGDIVACFKRTDNRQYVLAFMRQQIDLLRRSNRLGTAMNYEHALNSFSAFLGGRDILFGMLTERLVNAYYLYLEGRGIVPNSISFYMRILRSVYNKAVKQRFVEQTFPFQHVYTGIDRTAKRAIDESLVVQLYQLELPEASALDLARDLFIFSYCTRGMAFVDITYLKKSNIREGTICYLRHKTKQSLCIRIEAGIQKLIDKYIVQTADTPYVFPILKGTDPDEDFRRYRFALNTHNRMLKKLSGMLSCACRLTSYVARHSWATAARNRFLPLSVISACLGHTSERTTQIYLASLENSVLDSANLEIISGLK